MTPSGRLPEPPRPARLTPSFVRACRMGTILAIVLVLVGACFFLMGNAKRDSLARNGVWAKGTVVRRSSWSRTVSQKTRDDLAMVLVTVRFRAAGAAHHAVYGLRPLDAEAHPLGGAFPIIYDPVDPTSNSSARVTPGEVAALWGTGWLSLVLAVGVILGVRHLFYREALGQLHRLVHWPLARLTVDENAVPASGRSSAREVSGQFEDASGRRRTVDELYVPIRPRKGDPVLVLYDPEGDEVVALNTLRWAELTGEEVGKSEDGDRPSTPVTRGA